MLIDRIIAFCAAVGADIKSLTSALANKVDKVAGKGLSTNDYTTAEKSKLGGIASGATANATDAQLRDRSTHTGTQSASTISGLASVATSGSYTSLSNRPALGAAAAKEVTLSSRDRSSGRVLMVGDYGLGATPIPLNAGETIESIATVGGIFDRASGPVPSDSPTAGAAVKVFSLGNSSWPTQFAFAAYTEDMWIRARGSMNGSFRVWRRIYHSGNFATGSTAQYLRGDGSLATFPGLATTAAAGLMSAEDKSALDNLASGSTVPSWTSASRPTSGAVRLGFNETHQGLEYWNGSTWMRLAASKAWTVTFGGARFGDRL